MKTKSNPFRSHLFTLAGPIAFMFSATAQAVDYSYGPATTAPFTITATDQARDEWGDGQFNNTTGDMGVYWRGSSSDVTYMHFDLSSLAGETITGDVSLNQKVNAQYGGQISGGRISTANNTWTGTGATPGFTAIGDSATVTGSYGTGSTATWTLSNATFVGFVTTPATFYGLVLSAGNSPSNSTAHFHTDTPPTLTGTATSKLIKVTNATNWDAATFDEGTSTLTIAGSADATGGNVSIASGAVVSVLDSATLDSGNFLGSISNNGAVSFGSSASQTLRGAISGSGSLVRSGGGMLTLTGSNTYSGTTTINEGTLQVGDGGGTGKLGTGAVSIAGNLTVNRSGRYDTAGSNVFSGAGSITKEGTGELVIGGSGFHTNVQGISTVIVNNGMLRNDSWGLWNSNLDLTVANPGIFEMWNGNVSLANLSGSGTVRNTVDWSEWGGGNPAVGNTLTVAAGTFSGMITDLGITSGGSETGDTRIKLVKSGGGTLTLTGVNSYKGDTTVSGGTLSLGDGTSNTNLSDLATVSIAAGTTVHLNFTGSDFVGKLIIDGVTMPAGVYDSSSHSSYFTGSGSLEIAGGSGTWVSTVDGNWGDDTKWQSNKIASGGDESATFSAGTGSESITVTLDTARAIGSLAFSNATYTLAGANSLTLDSTSTPSISVATGLTATIATNIASSGGFEKSGTGTLSLSTANTYSGATTTISGGKLALLGSGKLFANLGWQGRVVRIQNGGMLEADRWDGAGSLGELNYNASNLVMDNGTIRFSGNSNGLRVDNGMGFTIGAGGATLESAAPAGQTWHINFETRAGGNFDIVSTQSGPLTLTGAGNGWMAKVIPGEGSVTKDGAGTWTLTAVNTYSGTTTATGGRLALGVNNALPETAVSIGNATLDAATFTDTVGTLDVTAAATINLGSGAALAFADSDAVDWAGGTLNIIGTLGAGSIRFGTDNTGLTTTQLGLISVNGSGAGTAKLDASGYLIVGGYSSWATGSEPFDGDANGDGVQDGLAWFLGAATPATNALDKLPKAAKDGAFLTLDFKRVNPYAAAKLFVQFGNDLSGWTTVEIPAADGIITLPGDDVEVEVAEGTPDSVKVKIPTSYQSASGTLFARLRATDN